MKFCYRRAGVVESFTAQCCGMHSHGFELPTRYMICKYVDEKGLATILISIQSAGVAPEVNLEIAQARKYGSKGSTPVLKPRADVTRSPKRGNSCPTKRTCVLHYF